MMNPPNDPCIDGRVRRKPRLRHRKHVGDPMPKRTRPGREWEPERGARDIWGATILFGPLVFQVFGTTILPLLEGLEVNAAYTHLIWPYAGDFTWVPGPGFNDEQRMAFADGLLNESCG